MKQAVSAKDVIGHRLDNPRDTLDCIGRKFGITRERVRQILSEHGLPTRRLKERRFCPTCGKELLNGNKYCDMDCYRQSCLVSAKCDACGRVFQRRASEVKPYPHLPTCQRKYHFCDRHCLGLWAGNLHGFVAHPENIKPRVKNETSPH